MNRFIRKFILHKYSEQITAIGKRPVFIISDDKEITTAISVKLNCNSQIQITENDAPFLKHIGSLAYNQFVGAEADYCQASSKFKGDKLEELLRKISFKNSFGNDYGFELNPLSKSKKKKLKGNMATFRWGAIIKPDRESYAGLHYLFENMKSICLFERGENNAHYNFLKEYKNCLCVETDEYYMNEAETHAKIYNFLGLEPQGK
jgi:hypothetical protein